MTAWFGGLPIHRKLTVSALAISGVSLLVALSGLIVIDIWRARALVADETASLARVIAQNIEASVIFDRMSYGNQVKIVDSSDVRLHRWNGFAGDFSALNSRVEIVDVDEPELGAGNRHRGRSPGRARLRAMEL